MNLRSLSARQVTGLARQLHQAGGMTPLVANARILIAASLFAFAGISCDSSSTAGTSGSAGATGNGGTTGGSAGTTGNGGTTGGAGTTGNGGTTGGGGTNAGGHGGNAGAGGRGGTGGAGGGTSCGGQTCSAGQICVHPSCGGVAPACNPVPDGGTCPTGYTLGFCQQVIGGGSGQGCQPPPCTPPAAYCADIPASCPSPPTCGCLPTSVCHGGGACVNVSASSVTCLSA